MSSASTSLPLFSDTFRFRIRAPVFFSSWLKWTSWSRTAVYAFTGTFTSPKLMVPLQTGRAMVVALPARRPREPERFDPAGTWGEERRHGAARPPLRARLPRRHRGGSEPRRGRRGWGDRPPRRDPGRAHA